MYHEQVPKGLIPVPGTLPFYNQAEVWTTDDEQGYTFDTEQALVYYRGKVYYDNSSMIVIIIPTIAIYMY